MYFHVRFQSALKINKRPIFSQKASIVLRTQSSFDGSTLAISQVLASLEPYSYARSIVRMALRRLTEKTFL